MHKLTKLIVVYLSVIAIQSCNTKKSPDTKNQSSPNSTELGAGKKVNIEEVLFNILQDWVNSQNTGDFNRYKSFYAHTFSGIKRAGENEYRYDAEGWLHDRQKMFNREMNVEARFILINYHQAPFRINFQQLWQSGSFSDYGPKLVVIDSVDGQLKIISEEMLASQLKATSNNTQSALDHPNFFLREGGNIIIDKQLKPTELLKTEMACTDGLKKEGLCVYIHQYAIEDTSLDDSLKSLLGRPVVFGNINSDHIAHGVTVEYRAIREELVDSLPGIFAPVSIFETRYSWRGYDKKLTPFHFGLHFGATHDAAIRRGQWVYISDTDPKIYRRDQIKDKSVVSDYRAKLDSIDHSDLILFTHENRKLLVSYVEKMECGDVYYEDVTLWDTSDENPLFVTDLPDLPAMILDLDGDNDLDILYETQLSEDPSIYIRWEAPNYALHGQDTVFLTCGC